MGDAATTTLPGGPETRRLSPKVRRLLREHGLDPGELQGTGRDRRITPADVQRLAGTGGSTRPAPRPDKGVGAVLASPLARRLLREAGLELRDAAAAHPQTRITRADAERAIEEARTTPPSRGPATDDIEMEVDVTRLLQTVAAARDVVERRMGIDLIPLAPIANAACRSLRRHPALNGSEAWPQDIPTPAPDVDLGLVVATGTGPALTTVPCAQDLTVTALAERIAGVASPANPGKAATGDGRTCTFAIADADPRSNADPAALLPGQVAVLTVGPVATRSVHVTDDLGQQAVATRWMSTLRLALHGRRIEDTAVTSFLDDLKRELETVDLLADVA